MADAGGIGGVSGAGRAAAVESGQAPAQQTGRRNSESVAPRPSAQSLALDMQEETGQLLSEKLERKTSEKRKVSSATAEVLQKKVEQIQEIRDAQDAMDRVPDMRSRKAEVERIAERAKGEGFSSPEDLLSFLEEQLGRGVGGEDAGAKPDPTQLYAALSHIESARAGGDDPVFAGLVSKAGDVLLSEHAGQINKGLIVSESAALYASEKLGSTQDLRGLYMDEVAADKGILGSFDSIMDKYGAQGYTEAVEYLLRAAGDDLARMNSSDDRTQQKHIIDNLYQLEVMNTVRERVDETFSRLEANGYEVNPEKNSRDVMREIFAMAGNPYQTTELKVTNLVASVVPQPIQAQISFLRELREAVSVVPPKIFNEGDMGEAQRLREQVIEAITQAQDVADEKEQEELDNA